MNLTDEEFDLAGTLKGLIEKVAMNGQTPHPLDEDMRCWATALDNAVQADIERRRGNRVHRCTGGGIPLSVKLE